MRFLVVDDEEAMRFLVRRWLRTAHPDAAVDEAASGEEALRLLETLPPGPLVVVSDFRMPPGMDGLTLLDEVRMRRPDARRVLLTGYSREEIGQRLETAQVDLYLEKGVDAAAFAASLQALARAPPLLDAVPPRERSW